ncbi:hypothetical protein NHX12_029297 [Muraenolepis orangiensis]|uniref:Ig-like domain-containing protein n=1 Tax=Muraenolepis orangiensis TaxID=630683 RepID=A0A9Q0IL21_9TELE|nr:hypothetical protein NHX12_029297 [Muraenolepis orangiensis]
MEVTSKGPQTIHRAQGDNVALGCTYTPGALDKGALDIEWYNVRPDMTQKDTLILSFTGGQVLHYGDTGFAKRMTFTGDPETGDATVSIAKVVESDTGTYQCKVKKAPGVDMRKVTLVVMVRPTIPKCWVEGGEEKGGDVSLRCKSSQGSIPLTYSWVKDSGGPIPITATQNHQTGELLIKNHSDSYIGNYICTAKNSVGQKQCKYALHAYNPTNKAGVIAGAKEVANEIREDVTAPESRPTSRNSSLRSVLAYRAHPGVLYSSLRKGQPSRAASGRSTVYSNGTGKSIGTGPSPAPLKYDSKYGYPV